MGNRESAKYRELFQNSRFGSVEEQDVGEKVLN